MLFIWWSCKEDEIRTNLSLDPYRVFCMLLFNIAYNASSHCVSTCSFQYLEDAGHDSLAHLSLIHHTYLHSWLCFIHFNFFFFFIKLQSIWPVQAVLIDKAAVFAGRRRLKSFGLELEVLIKTFLHYCVLRPILQELQGIIPHFSWIITYRHRFLIDLMEQLYFCF